MFFRQAPEVEDRGFIGNTIQVQPGKLAQDRGFVERCFHCRIAVTELVLHQMHPATWPSTDMPDAHLHPSDLRLNQGN